MKLVSSKRSKKTGLPPGTLVHTGSEKVTPSKITAYCYDANGCTFAQPKTAKECYELINSQQSIWINVEGVHDIDLLKEFGEVFNLHPLTLEDIASTGQRARREEMDHYLFVVLQMIYHRTNDRAITVEQVSMILSKNFLITFQEGHEGDVFKHVRNRLEASKGRLRKMGPDYLAYALLDSIVDYYFVILEEIGEKIEHLEHSIIDQVAQLSLKSLYELKRIALFMRRSAWPIRELISSLSRDESPYISHQTEIFFRDLYGHVVEIIDSIEVYREMLSNLFDLYLSSVSNRLNTVMKFLTLIATIFMPLTFIAGVYGMNFKHMPELEWQYGYPASLLLMALVTGFLVWFFKKRGWV